MIREETHSALHAWPLSNAGAPASQMRQVSLRNFLQCGTVGKEPIGRLRATPLKNLDLGSAVRSRLMGDIHIKCQLV